MNKQIPLIIFIIIQSIIMFLFFILLLPPLRPMCYKSNQCSQTIKCYDCHNKKCTCDYYDENENIKQITCDEYLE